MVEVCLGQKNVFFFGAAVRNLTKPGFPDIGQEKKHSLRVGVKTKSGPMGIFDIGVTNNEYIHDFT